MSGNNVETEYVYSGVKPIAEYTNGALSKEYIYAGSQLVASVDASGNTVYYHPDHLSTRVETDAGANVLRTFGHLPFGDVWYECGVTCPSAPLISDKWKFTSYERDAESEPFDYAVFRSYSSLLGRFIQSDPARLAAVDPQNPQSWNLYAYVFNIPTIMIDPLGLDGYCIGDTCYSNVWSTVLGGLGDGGAGRGHAPVQDVDDTNDPRLHKKKKCILQRIRLTAEAIINLETASDKFLEAATAGLSTEATGPAGVAGAVYGGIGGAGNLTAAGADIYGAISGDVGAADKAAGVATTVTTVGGLTAFTVSGGNLEAGELGAEAETIGAAGVRGGITGRFVEKSLDSLAGTLQGYELGRSILDAIGITPGEDCE